MSATNEFGKLDHRAPLAQPVVRRVGSGWDTPTGTTIRDDRTTYLPLQMPGGLQPQPEPLPPPAPSEAKLRETLAQCILARDFTADSVARAQASTERARAYVGRCKAKLESFASLEDEAMQRAIEALQSEAGRLDLDDETMRLKRMERESAAAAVRASERAASVLDAALADAQADADHAAQAARRAAVAVAAIEAERLAQHVLELEDQAAREREVLRGFDRVNANTNHPLPASVFNVVSVGGDVALMRPLDATAWQAALDRLLTDATAEVVIPIPERRPKPTLRYSHEVRVAVPISDWKPTEEPEAEPSGTPLPEPGEVTP